MQLKNLVRNMLGVASAGRIKKAEQRIAALEKSLKAKAAAERKRASEAALRLSLGDQTSLAASVWEEHDDEEYRKWRSHWRGVGEWSDDEEWLETGRRTLRRIDKAYRTLSLEPPKPEDAVVLEWGPGGGSNLLALSDRCSKLIGIDISQKNLDESGRMLKEANQEHFEGVLLTGAPSTVLQMVEPKVTHFLSTAVFQHFPSKEYGVEVLQVVEKLMLPGAIGVVQIRYDDGNPRYAPKSLDRYKKKHITATSYGISEFWVILKNCGFEPLFVDGVRAQNNYVWFGFQKPGAEGK